MKYRTLTGTGISVSNLALGTMGFGSEKEPSRAATSRAVHERSQPGEFVLQERRVHLGRDSGATFRAVGLQPQSPLSGWT